MPGAGLMGREELYLEKLAAVLRDGVHDLHDAADRLRLPYDVVCCTFNNGLLKGMWTITVLEDPRVLAAT